MLGAGVPLPVRLVRHLQAGALLLLPAGAPPHLPLLPAGQRHAHVPLRAAPRLQLHGRHRAPARQELLPWPRRHRDRELALVPLASLHTLLETESLNMLYIEPKCCLLLMCMHAAIMPMPAHRLETRMQKAW